MPTATRVYAGETTDAFRGRLVDLIDRGSLIDRGNGVHEVTGVRVDTGSTGQTYTALITRADFAGIVVQVFDLPTDSIPSVATHPASPPRNGPTAAWRRSAGPD
jgi:hypothetical protein